MRREDYTAANREAWNEVQPIHAARNLERLRAGFRSPGFTCFNASFEEERLRALGLAGRAVAQLACNNGRETLSFLALGAARVVGFDIAEAFIAEARELAAARAAAGGAGSAEFVAGDVYAIPPSWNGLFGLVYVSVGALCWMPDLPGFFAVAARLLEPSGRLFVCETHPFLDVFEPAAPGAPPALAHSYFATAPDREVTGLDYYGRTTYPARPSYWFPHRLADVFAAILGAGLALESFEEFPDEVGHRFPGLESLATRLPASYILVARKGAGR